MFGLVPRPGNLLFVSTSRYRRWERKSLVTIYWGAEEQAATRRPKISDLAILIKVQRFVNRQSPVKCNTEIVHIRGTWVIRGVIEILFGHQLCH